MAYHFNWQKNDIMEMTMKERQVWLKQIERIHREKKLIREHDIMRQIEYLNEIKSRETEEN